VGNYVTDLQWWTATTTYTHTPPTWVDLYRRIPADGPLGLTRLRYEKANRGE
jgi:hypothetical protein